MQTFPFQGLKQSPSLPTLPRSKFPGGTHESGLTPCLIGIHSRHWTKEMTSDRAFRTTAGAAAELLRDGPRCRGAGAGAAWEGLAVMTFPTRRNYLETVEKIGSFASIETQTQDIVRSSLVKEWILARG